MSILSNTLIIGVLLFLKLFLISKDFKIEIIKHYYLIICYNNKMKGVYR